MKNPICKLLFPSIIDYKGSLFGFITFIPFNLFKVIVLLNLFELGFLYNIYPIPLSISNNVYLYAYDTFIGL